MQPISAPFHPYRGGGIITASSAKLLGNLQTAQCEQTLRMCWSLAPGYLLRCAQRCPWGGPKEGRRGVGGPAAFSLAFLGMSGAAPTHCVACKHRRNLHCICTRETALVCKGWRRERPQAVSQRHLPVASLLGVLQSLVAALRVRLCSQVHQDDYSAWTGVEGGSQAASQCCRASSMFFMAAAATCGHRPRRASKLGLTT